MDLGQRPLQGRTMIGKTARKAPAKAHPASPSPSAVYVKNLEAEAAALREALEREATKTPAHARLREKKRVNALQQRNKVLFDALGDVQSDADRADALKARCQGSKRVIQRRFNVGVL